MFLKNSRKILKNIPVRSVIFVSFVVMIVAGSAWVLKNVHAKDFLRNRYRIFFHNILLPDIRFELFELFIKHGFLLFKGDGGLLKLIK